MSIGNVHNSFVIHNIWVCTQYFSLPGRFVGDPASLARNNIFLYTLLYTYSLYSVFTINTQDINVKNVITLKGFSTVLTHMYVILCKRELFYTTICVYSLSTLIGV